VEYETGIKAFGENDAEYRLKRYIIEFLDDVFLGEG